MTIQDADSTSPPASVIPIVGDQPVFTKQLNIIKHRPSWQRVLSIPGFWHLRNAAFRAALHAWSGFGLYSISQLLGVVFFDKMHSGVNAAATTRTLELLLRVTGSALARIHPEADTVAKLLDATKPHKVQHIIAHLFAITMDAVALHHGIRENRPDVQLAAVAELAPLFAALGRHPYALVCTHLLENRDEVEAWMMKVGGVGFRDGHAMAVDESLELCGVRPSKQHMWSTRMDQDALRTHITTLDILTQKSRGLVDACFPRSTKSSSAPETSCYDEVVTHAADVLESTLRLSPEEAANSPLFRSAACVHSDVHCKALFGLKADGKERLDASYYPEVRGLPFKRKGRGARAVPNVVYEVKASKRKTKAKEAAAAQATLLGAKDAANEGDIDLVKKRLDDALDQLLSYPPLLASPTGEPIRAKKSETLAVYRSLAPTSSTASGGVLAIDLTQLMMKIFVEGGGEREVGEIAEVAWQRAQSLRNVHTLILVADRPEQVPAAKIFEQLSRQPALSPMSGIYQQRSTLLSELEECTDGGVKVTMEHAKGSREVRDAVTGKVLDLWSKNKNLFPNGTRSKRVLLDGPGMPAPILLTKGKRGITEVETMKRTLHFGEADVALFAYALQLQGLSKYERITFDINDTDALDVGLAASVRRLNSHDGSLVQSWYVRKPSGNGTEVFDVNAIFGALVRASPASWTPATSVLSFVCARVASGNDYKEQAAGNPCALLEQYLANVQQAEPLAEASWNATSGTASIDISHAAIRACLVAASQRSLVPATETAYDLSAKRAVVAADYATCLARGATGFENERWVSGGGFVRLHEETEVSAHNIAIAWDATPRRTLTWPAPPAPPKTPKRNKRAAHTSGSPQAKKSKAT